MASVVIIGPTVMTTASDTVPVRAVIVAEPAAIPVTTPALLTVAIVLSEDAHYNVTPNRVWPFWSSATADNCAVLPTAAFRGPLMTTPAITVVVGPLELP